MLNGQTGSYHRGPFSADKFTHWWGFLRSCWLGGDDRHKFIENTYVCKMYIYTYWSCI